MRKISLLLLFILCTGTLPISASNFLSVNMNFNNDPQREIAQFETFYGSTLTNISGYDGKAAELANFSGDFAAARLTFGAPSLNTLTVAQTIRIAKSKEAQIRLLADGKHIAIISFAQSEVKALGSDGWIRLRSYTADSWYRVQIRVDTTSKYYEVMIDGIKLGGAIPCVGEFIKADSVQYSVQGADSIFLFDDLSIFEEQQAETYLSNSESTASASRRAYYGTYQPRYDLYQAPHEDVIAGERVTGEITASSTAEGFSPDAVMDGNVSTKWQAAPAAKPIDYGKSLMLNKTGATDGTQLAAFNFAPVKGTLVIEEDVLAADVFGEKAIPYVFSSNGNMSATMLMNGDRFLIAGTANDYRDLSSDTWYHLKMELNTETQTYNVYVNNEVWIQNVPFRSHCPDFSKIQFHMGGNSYGTFCVDNLKIYTVSPLGYFKELILEDNFEKYEEGTTSLNSWNISPSTMGEVSIQRYGVQSEYKFTQTLNIDVERESDFEGAYLVIPDGISIKYSLEISRKNGYYLPVSDKTDRFYSGEQIVYYSPVRSRHLRLTIYDAIDTLGNTVHAQLSEMKVVLKHREPVANIAFAAKTEVSGSASSDYDKRGINDNIVAEFGNIGEWWSGSEPDKWVELTWDTPQTVDRVILHDSASLTDHTKSGVLSFDDGSTIEVTNIANSGMPKTVDFDAKTIRRLRFTITDYEGHANISELQVFLQGDKPELPQYLEPDEVVRLDPDYAGRWCAINDIDNDGELEYVCAKVVNLVGDSHYAGSIGAQESDGTILWTWGDPKTASKAIGSDVPMQIYDINHDGQLEVLVCSQEELFVLNALNGEEMKRYKLPKSEKYPNDLASDTIAIADISGKGYASDIIVKSRYREAWAYTENWELIWHVCMPDGMKVGHYPQPIDIDNDGYDEVFIGFSCIDEDGSIVFSINPAQYPGVIEDGHKDSLEVVNFVLTGDTTGDFIINQKDLDLLNKHLAQETVLTGNAFLAADTDGNGKIEENDKKLLEQKLAGKLLSFPNKGLPKEEQRFTMTPCGGGSNIITFDGNGNRIWSLDDATHYETIEKANLGLDDYPFQLIVTNAGVGEGNAPFAILSLDGNILNERFGYMRNRQFNPINWTGEGTTDYLLLPTDNIVVDGNFDVKVKPLMPYRGYDTMAMKSYQTGKTKYTCDMDGDGTTDIAIQMDGIDSTYIYIYYNKDGAKVADAPGRGYNISQY